MSYRNARGTFNVTIYAVNNGCWGEMRAFKETRQFLTFALEIIRTER